MEIKYCSRCGFEMELIPQLLANGGKLSEVPGNSFLTRKNVTFFSVVLMMLTIFLAVALESLAGMHNLAPMLALLGFCLGVISIMAAYLFLPSESAQDRMAKSQQAALPNANTQQLPPQQSISVDDYVRPSDWKAPDTNDLAQPLSVTDNTTKLLEKDI